MRRFAVIMGLLAAALALALPAPAQVQFVSIEPDCRIYFSYAAVGTSASFDNRTRGCDFWVISYSSFTFAGPLSLAVQRAPNAAGSVPGAWANFAGAEVTAGINPNTSLVGAESQMTGYYPWVRVNLTATGAGAGLVVGTAFGWRTGPPAAVAIMGIVGTNLAQYGGVAVGAANALHVRSGAGALFNLGTVVAGADGILNAAQVNPAAGAGGLANFQYYLNSGSTWDRVRGSVAGAWVQGPAATAAAVVGNPVITGGYGSGVAPGVVAGNTVCDLNAPITLAAAAGYTEIIPLAAARSIRVCHISLSMTAPVDINLARAPAGACAGPVAITGVYSTAMALSMDFVNGPVVLTAANSLCINLGQAVAGGGLVTYALY